MSNQLLQKLSNIKLGIRSPKVFQTEWFLYKNCCAQCFMPIKRIFGVLKLQKFLMLRNLKWKEKQLNKIKYLLCKFYKHARRTKLPQFATSLRVLFT